jgi:hypothetical protein
MNSLETEYSFLAPTWKLPPVGTSAMYPGTTYSPTLPKLTPNGVGKNNEDSVIFHFIRCYL